MRDLNKLALCSKPVHLIETKDWTGAPSTADIFSMKNYGHATIIIQTGAWAAGNAAVTVTQETSISGSDAQALTITEMFTGCVLGSDDLLVRTTVTAGTFNLSVANKLYIIEIDASDLDVDDGFDCLELNIASPGGNSDFYGAIAILSQPRYLKEMPPTAITN